MSVVDINDDAVKLTVSGVASKSHRVKEIHLHNLLRDKSVGVWSDTVRPVIRQFFLHEKGRHGEQVRSVASSTRWEEFVEERCGAVEEQTERSKVEIWVFSLGLIVTLLSVERQAGRGISVVEPTFSVFYTHPLRSKFPPVVLVIIANNVLLKLKLSPLWVKKSFLVSEELENVSNLYQDSEVGSTYSPSNLL